MKLIVGGSEPKEAELQRHHVRLHAGAGPGCGESDADRAGAG